MTDSNTTPPKKRGPKPVGDAAMTTAERQRRRREQLRSAGGKGFLLELEGLHLQHVEALAQSKDMSTAAALRRIVEPALDRYVGLMRRVERMIANGATPEQVAEFMQAHWMPELPPMPSEGAAEK